ncbi:MAG: phytoene/squalene synthase family protein [Limibacillus sp.]
MALAEDYNYCAAEVRRFDHDRYLSLLLAAEPLRRSLLAIYAFNLEIARTAESVSEPMIGQIRLQWWRDSIEGLYGGAPRRNAVIQPLEEAISTGNLTRSHFEGLIDARERDLDPDPPESLAALERYAEATSVPVMLLGLEAAGVREGPALKAARHAGLALALTGILRATAFLTRQRRILLPLKGMRAADVSPQELLDGRLAPSALSPVVRPIAERAARHLMLARRDSRRIDRHALPVFWPATLAELHLRRLHAAGFDPFDARVQEAPPARPWRLLGARLLGRF